MGTGMPTWPPDGRPPSAAAWRHSAPGRRGRRGVSARTAARPGVRARFERMLRVAQRYAVIREEQSRRLPLAWPVLRTCARRLGAHLTEAGMLARAEDLHFCTRAE